MPSRLQEVNKIRIAVRATGKDLDSNVDSRFERAAYFIIVNSETMEYETVENTLNLNLSQGAGIQAGKTIIDNNADVLITGNCGPKAFKVLQSAGVKFITGTKGCVSKGLISIFKCD